MKTAISLTNDLFESVEKLASKMNISRSELFQNAIRNYIEDKETTYITNKLNEVYSVHDSGNSSLDPVLKEIQLKSLKNDSPENSNSSNSNEAW
jgi:metal-responsive CopG/Arc/MetJ family transcriptional regulator